MKLIILGSLLCGLFLTSTAQASRVEIGNGGYPVYPPEYGHFECQALKDPATSFTIFPNGQRNRATVELKNSHGSETFDTTLELTQETQACCKPLDTGCGCDPDGIPVVMAKLPLLKGARLTMEFHQLSNFGSGTLVDGSEETPLSCTKSGI
jgi:hypothetical protein